MGHPQIIQVKDDQDFVLKTMVTCGSFILRRMMQDGPPKIAFSWFITGLTMVYGRYNYR